MANDRYTDLLRKTREEIVRRGTQEQERERNRRQQAGAQFARNAANGGIRGAYGVMTFENGAEIQERNRANRYISEYRDLQNAYGQSGAEADESILQQMKQLNQKYGFSGIQDAENKLDGLEAGKWMEDRNQLYSNLESNPDFEQYSKPSSKTPTAGFGIQFGKHWLGKGDAKYDYINNLGSAQELAAEARGQEDTVNPYGMYDLMKPEEVARYNYLYHTQGEKAADEYLGYLEYTLSERSAQKVQQTSKALTEAHPQLASGLSVFSKLQSGVGLLDVAAQKARNTVASALTGEEQKPINFYRAAAPSIATSAIRGTRSQQIADKYGVIHFDEKEHPVLSKVLNGKGLADVYQLGMSMVDSLAAGKLAPGIGKAGTVLLGGSAGTQAMLDAAEKGATDDQAIMMGLLNGAAEIVFETYEVENLLGSSSNMLKSVLNQALTEAIGEGATTISNNLADILVMQDKSEFMTKIQEYQNQGMSKEKAELQAFLDAAIAVGWDSFGGALSGGLFGLAGPKVSEANDTNQNVNTTRNSDFVIEEGAENGPVTQQSDPGNEAQKAAQAPQEAQTQQTSPVQAAQTEAAAGSVTLNGALEYYRENGRVSNSVAERVLSDPAAVQELQERTGIKIPGTTEGATHTQKRNAVKGAIAQLTAERPGMSQQGAVDTFVDSIQELREENTGKVAAPEQAGGAANAELDAAIGPALRGESSESTPSIKKQIMSSQDDLNSMDAVASIDIPDSFSGLSKSGKMSWIIEKLRPTNFRVSREGFGVINFDAKRLKSAFNYFKKGGAEEAAFEALPYVLQNGKEISSRDKHKGRDYGTATIAAPVTINGRRGNMAVVVKKTTENFYKVHRILTPDGSEFQLSETAKEAGPTPAGESPKNGSLATPIGPASDNIVQHNGEEVNRNSEEHGAVGAAERNFSGKADYQELLHEGNVQRDRPGDVRPVEVPKTNAEGKKVSEFAGNAYGAQVTPDAMASEIESLIQDGYLSYDTRTNRESLENARDYIYGKDGNPGRGEAETRYQIRSNVDKGRIQDGDIEKAMLLYAKYANRKSKTSMDNASSMMVMLQEMATMSGRNLQLFSMFQKMTPEGQLMTVQKTVQRSVENLIKNGQVKKGYEPSIDPQLQEDYLKAAREAQKAESPGDVDAAKRKLDAVENAILLSEAAKMPVTFRAKWNAWRYMAMLGNVKTQIRNVFGNAMFVTYKSAKDAFGAAMERAIPKDQRTKSVLNLFTEADRDLLSWAMADGKSKQVQDALKYSAKLGDDVSADVIRENMRIFDSDALEAVRKAAEWAPSFGDMMFKNPYYETSLAGFLKARGYTAQNVTDGTVSENVLQEARSYAIQEAMKATFNDQNAFSDAIVNFRYKGDNPVLKAANLLGEGIMPFRRTPANIVMRGVEYSPAGFGKGIWNMATKVRSGQMSAASAIDQMASGLTGTGMMLLGYTLASGIFGIKLRGSGADDDEKRRGIQDYSIEFSIGGKDYSYTIDWAAPANLPLFVGANLYDAFHDRQWDSSVSGFTKVIYAMRDTLEPMLSLSCLSSLNDAIESGKYADDGNAIYAFFSQAAFNYFTQGVPALLRQTVQAFHKNKRTTFANNQDPLLREAERKIGGVALLGEAFRTDKINQWGETESAGGPLRRIIDAYFNPGTLKEIDNSALEMEIQRLNSSQPESVSPPDTAKTITYTDSDGNRHANYRLTEEEYNTLQTVQGQTAYDILNEIISSDAYENLTDDQKARAFGYIYDYARERGRMAAIDGYEGNLANWMKDIEGSEASAVFRKIISADFTDSFDSVIKGAEGASDSLQRAYDSYYDLPPQEQKAFLEDAEGRVKYMIHAGDAGMSAETFASMYQTYRSIDKRDLSISQKANQWSYELQRAYERGDITKKQMQTLKKDMVFRYFGVVDTPKFDSMVEAGISGGDAKKVVDLLAGLKPESGYKSVRDIQNAEAILNSGLSNRDTVEALYAYLPSAQDENLREMLDMGFSAQDYVAAWRLYDSESGEGKKRRTIDSYRSMFDVDYETAKMIYEIYG